MVTMNKTTKKILSISTGILVLAGLYAVLGFMVLPHGGYHEKYEKQYQESQKKHKDPTVFPTVKGKVVPGLNLQEMYEATPKVLAKGKKLFGENCAACHGANGKGDGPAAPALHPHPRDFASPKGWTRGYTIADIYTTLSEGVKGTAMGAYDTIPPKDRFALAHYVQSFGKFNHHNNFKKGKAELDQKFHLSQGIHEPNKVAVPIIMKHMESEFHAPAAVKIPPAGATGEGAILCRKMIADPVKAAEVLSQVKNWRKDMGVFAQAAMSDTPRNGFQPSVATMTKQQWQAFHDELVKITPVPSGEESGNSGD